MSFADYITSTYETRDLKTTNLQQHTEHPKDSNGAGNAGHIPLQTLFPGYKRIRAKQEREIQILTRETRFICRFCRKGIVYGREALLKHFQESHYHRYQYNCPRCDRDFYRKDNLRDHWNKIHSHDGELFHSLIFTYTESLPSPEKCDDCGSPVFSWDEFFWCMLVHSVYRDRILGTDTSTTEQTIDNHQVFNLEGLKMQLEAKESQIGVDEAVIKTNDAEVGGIRAQMKTETPHIEADNAQFQVEDMDHPPWTILSRRLRGNEESLSVTYMSPEFQNMSHDPKSSRILEPCTDSSYGPIFHDRDQILNEISVGKHYASELADALLNEMAVHITDSQSIEKISRILPRFLKEFGLKIGHDAPSQMHRDVMVFIHRYRNIIAAIFNERCLHRDDRSSDIDIQAPRGDRISILQMMSRWYNKDKDSPEDGIPSDIDMACLGEAVEVEEEDTKALPSLPEYMEFILDSPAYAWLLGILHREATLAPSDPNIMKDLQMKILQYLPSDQTVTRRESTLTHATRFTVHWDPVAFFRQQGYTENPYEALQNAITLAGTATDAQASTCVDYVRKTWPSSGERIMQLIEHGILDIPVEQTDCNIPGLSRLIAEIKNSKLFVWVWGTAVTISEIGQQLAWLGAALRSSSRETGVTYCTPVIRGINVDRNFHEGQTQHQMLCEIGFLTDESAKEYSNGQCWHWLFKNPVVVSGYPIAKRPEQNTGLEIPLNMMAALAQTPNVTVFNERIFLKGFSTILVPTWDTGSGLIIWHLLYNSDGDRLSYLDTTVPHVAVDIVGLESCRHVLGWCTSAQFYAGAADAEYIVRPSKLPKCQPGSILEGVSISAGRIVTGSSFAIGRKDIRIERNGYVEKLKWLYRQFVVLWDEEEKQGWLVNGASTLLHILRGYLVNESTGKFRSAFLLKPKDLDEASDPHTADSSIEVLLRPENRELRLYSGNKETTVLEDRILQLYGSLEQMIDYQYFQNRINGNKPRLGRYLEGWNFDDLVKGRDPFYPRVSQLESPSAAWLDLTRDINTIALFGRGFGDILRPNTHNLCVYWDKMPTQSYYLGATISDLKEIMDNHGGDEDSTPMQLTENIAWYNPNGIWRPCRCSRKNNNRQHKHCNPVQILLPHPLQGEPPDSSPVVLQDGGAVIFGWNGDPNGLWSADWDGTGEILPPASTESDAQLEDSGMGSSLTTSTTPDTFRVEIPTTPMQYKVGIVCALPKELLAVRALFDETYECVFSSPLVHDTNNYVFGLMAHHYVVAACLPCGEYGTNSAAAAVIHMRRSFPGIEFCLLVGIGGGIPSDQNDIRLGDIVVSLPTDTHTGVIQFDLGKAHSKQEFQRTGSLQRPPRVLMTAISHLQSNPHDSSSVLLQRYIRHIKDCNPGYKRPGKKYDKLFNPAYDHDPSHETCKHCDGPVIERKPRQSRGPYIHYGLIASGNQVMKDAHRRDHLGKEFNALCIEMEAAGAMNSIPCLVIRGICDYADSHKHKLWQEYAAATAAAYAKLLLSATRMLGDDAKSMSEGSEQSANYALKHYTSLDNIPRSKRARQQS